MSKIMYMGEEYCGVGIGGGSGGTETPTANTTAAFDSSANMNSTDMTSAEINTYIDSLNIGELSPIDDSVISLYTSFGWVQD